MLSSPRSDLKVVCVGQPKTGTTSINKLLEILGIKTVSNPYVLDEMTSELLLDNDTMFDMLNDSVDDLSDICDSFQGFSDLPYSFMSRWFIEKYPSTKFILTMRDSSTWFRSISTYMKIPHSCSLGIMESLYGSKTPDPTLYPRMFDYYNQDIMDYFKKINKEDQLLVINLFENDNELGRILEFLGFDEDAVSTMPHENPGRYEELASEQDPSHIVPRHSTPGTDALHEDGGLATGVLLASMPHQPF